MHMLDGKLSTKLELPYVQVAILNLPHYLLRSTTILLDMYMCIVTSHAVGHLSIICGSNGIPPWFNMHVQINETMKLLLLSFQGRRKEASSWQTHLRLHVTYAFSSPVVA